MHVPYQYLPLEKPNEIRLLHLSRQGDGSPAFRLAYVLLDDAPDFEAVSYTWGSENRANALRHADSAAVVRITANCEETIRSLCTLQSSVFWLDAVCINQNSIAERNQQVKIMGQIFRKAKRTIAYVGGEDPSISYLEERLATMARRAPINLHSLPASFFRRPWFKRTWVIQEALLSKELVVRVGEKNLDTDQLMIWSYGLVFDTVLTLKAAFSASSAVYEDAEYERESSEPSERHLWREPPAISRLLTRDTLINWGRLLDLLCASWHYHCRDPRDKVFALVSLFNGDMPSDLVPDYELDLQSVYTNVTRFLLCYGVARALAAAPGVSAAPGMPTWVVDWRTEPHKKGRYEGGWYHADATFMTGASSAKRTGNIVAVGKDAIRIRGLRVAVIDTSVLSRSRIVLYSDATEESEVRIQRVRSSMRLSVERWPNRPTSSHQHEDEEHFDEYSSDSDDSLHMPVKPRSMFESCISGLSCHRGLDQFVQADDDDGEGNPSGYLPTQTMVGDWICVLVGFRTPFVLRAIHSGWQVVGECYFHGLMHGEAMQGVEPDAVSETEPIAPLEDFLLF